MNPFHDITDEELSECLDLIPFEDDTIYSFILTRDKNQRDEAIKEMECCVHSIDIKLSNGNLLYFAFDYFS